MSRSVLKILSVLLFQIWALKQANKTLRWVWFSSFQLICIYILGLIPVYPQNFYMIMECYVECTLKSWLKHRHITYRYLQLTDPYIAASVLTFDQLTLIHLLYYPKLQQELASLHHSAPDVWNSLHRTVLKSPVTDRLETRLFNIAWTITDFDHFPPTVSEVTTYTRHKLSLYIL